VFSLAPWLSLGGGELVLRYHCQVLSPLSLGALKWMFTFKVSLASAKPTKQLTQYPLVQIFSENTVTVSKRCLTARNTGSFEVTMVMYQ